MNTLTIHLESLLFYKAEPLGVSKIASLLGVTKEEILAAADDLTQKLEGRGICLIRSGDELSLATVPESTQMLASIAENEAASPLSRAALETLAIIMYRGPLTASSIDYIRGVSSHYVLRSLLMRGLIERKESKDRAYEYSPSFKLLSNLGITDIRNLPEYEAVMAEFAAKVDVNPAAPEPDELETLE